MPNEREKELLFYHQDPDLKEGDLEAFKRVLRSRRSVRVFEDLAIADSVIEDCLESATLAPNSSNLQPWEFYWVKDQKKKQLIIEACFSQPAAKTAQALIICVARTDTWKRNNRLIYEFLKAKGDKVSPAALNYHAKMVPYMYSLGPLNVFGILKKVVSFYLGFFKAVPRKPFNKAGLQTWAVKSTALACENLMLAFRAHGYDSCPMEGLDSYRVKKVLGLGRHAVVTMAIGAGKRSPKGVYGRQMRLNKKYFIKEV